MKMQGREIGVLVAGLLAWVACDATSSKGEDAGGSPMMDDGGDDDTGGDGGSGGDGMATGDGGGTMPADDGADGMMDDSGGADDGGGMTIDPANMVDNFEDGDGLITPANGRQGAWYTYNDESATGTQVPAADEPFAPVAGGPPDSLFMAQTSGSGFSVWGAGLGVDLNNEGDDMGGPGIRHPYDASGFTGIAFMARGSGAIRVKLLVEAVVPTATGGTCEGEGCEDAHGQLVSLGDDWKQYTVGFDAVFQEGWGATASFDPATLMAIQFQVGKEMEFEFEIDDVGFY